MNMYLRRVLIGLLLIWSATHASIGSSRAALPPSATPGLSESKFQVAFRGLSVLTWKKDNAGTLTEARIVIPWTNPGRLRGPLSSEGKPLHRHYPQLVIGTESGSPRYTFIDLEGLTVEVHGKSSGLSRTPSLEAVLSLERVYPHLKAATPPVILEEMASSVVILRGGSLKGYRRSGCDKGTIGLKTTVIADQFIAEFDADSPLTIKLIITATGQDKETMTFAEPPALIEFRNSPKDSVIDNTKAPDLYHFELLEHYENMKMKPIFRRLIPKMKPCPLPTSHSTFCPPLESRAN